MCPFFVVQRARVPMRHVMNCHETVAERRRPTGYEWAPRGVPRGRAIHRKTTRQMKARALLMVLSIGALAACGGLPSVGNVALHATATAPISSLHYEITAAGLPRLTGTVSSPVATKELSSYLSHVPVGRGDVVTVEATTPDGQLSCHGSATFDVRRNATTQVTLALLCRAAGDGPGTGIVRVVIDGVSCPELQVTSYSVSPLTASIGASISVSATTSPTDGGAVTYAWTASSGTFAQADAPTTTYTCTAPGAATLTIAAMSGACRDAKSVTVSCGADAGAD
jgi:hypothetical protein